ncbi:MAG: translocase [Candidatus Aramenus sulfurataquae]|jgi:sec-independent protein translocase protein TatA|uniref:Twin-arginine translocase TatA/TatE family subunit n=2 Tax=Candidatus Aramenus sulfurataquae TaxID=1326980 RepID=A0AAE3FKW0_9CREN|nr:twin-arginine translocase TatA/TatE family subunit [Candidatus Aramenus sulfurataquae]
MIGNISDFLIVLIVGILLLSGQKDISSTAKNIGKTLNQLKRTQEQFRQELAREINGGLGDVAEETKKSVVTDVTPMYRRVNKISPQPVTTLPSNGNKQEDKIKQIEDEIKRLQMELERLKQNGNKN